MKKLFSAVLFFCFTTFFVQPSAHAALILSQDYYAYNNSSSLMELIGTVSVNIDESEELAAPDYFTFNWFTLEFFGISFTQAQDDIFYALFEIDNLAAGFSFLQFEILDVASNTNLQFIYDGNLGDGLFDIFQNGDGFAFEATAGDVRVTVPAPATVFLMLSCLVGLGLTRRRKL